MKKIILYGAGKHGKKIAELLREKGILIEGFLDSYIAEGEIACGDDGQKYRVLSLDDIGKNKSDYQVIIAIADYKEATKVREKLKGMEIVRTEDVLRDAHSIIANNRQFIADYHDTEMEDYYSAAEAEESLNRFWGGDSDFYEMFSELNLDHVIELACGHGRHVEKYKRDAGQITLVDMVEKNIAYCKQRFSDEPQISYYVNNGHDLSELHSGVYSALFTYDAMVHFEMMDVFEYLKETERVLKSGGKALFHHSNNTEDYRVTFSTGTYGRNYMSAQLFAYLANRAGLKVLGQKLIDWGSAKNLDCLTLVLKV